MSLQVKNAHLPWELDLFRQRVRGLNYERSMSSKCKKHFFGLRGVKSVRLPAASFFIRLSNFYINYFISGYAGKRCEVKKDYCKGSPCFNGECIDQQWDFVCKCEPGLLDRNIETIWNLDIAIFKRLARSLLTHFLNFEKGRA